MQEYYKVLGLTESATNEEIESAYSALKEKYQEDRFLEGEAGNEAARKLTLIEEAYREIKDSRNNQKNEESGSTENFKLAEKYLKEGDFAKAQSVLDDISERTAEWHYLQAVIFYKKNWMHESKKQLLIAMNMEPNNEKYSETYSKLNQKMSFNEKQFKSGNAYQNNAQPENRQMGGEGLNECMSFCTTWCCTQLLCSMCCR